MLADAPDEFAVAGFSLGGYLALELIKQAPERVSHLALVSTQARADSTVSKRKRLDQIRFVERRNTVATLTRAMCTTLVHSTQLEKPDIRDTLLRMATQTGVETFVAQHQAAISRQDRRDALSAWGRLGRPALVVGGSDDGLIPHANHIEMHRILCDAQETVQEAGPSGRDASAPRMVSLSDCGHMSCLEQPALVAEAMEEWIQQEHEEGEVSGVREQLSSMTRAKS